METMAGRPWSRHGKRPAWHILEGHVRYHLKDRVLEVKPARPAGWSKIFIDKEFIGRRFIGPTGKRSSRRSRRETGATINLERGLAINFGEVRHFSAPSEKEGLETRL